MSNKPEDGRRNTDRRKERRCIGLYDDSGDAAGSSRDPQTEKVREAWRQILDRRHGGRRLDDQSPHAPADAPAANGIEAGS